MVVFWGTCDAWRVCIHMSTFTILNWIMALMMMQARHLVVEKHANKLIGLAESAHPFRQITCTEPDASPPLCHPSSPTPPSSSPIVTTARPSPLLITPRHHELNSIHLSGQNALPTDGRTDGWTDRPSNRDARTHLKRDNKFCSFLQNANVITQELQGLLRFCLYCLNPQIILYRLIWL